MVTLVLRQALKMHLKIAVALCPPTSQRTAQPWPASPPVYNRSNAFSAFDITCQVDNW